MKAVSIFIAGLILIVVPSATQAESSEGAVRVTIQAFYKAFGEGFVDRGLCRGGLESH